MGEGVDLVVSVFHILKEQNHRRRVFFPSSYFSVVCSPIGTRGKGLGQGFEKKWIYSVI